jgi:putative endonuclease
MFFAYVLKSQNNDYYYKGHCEDFNERLSQHNAGMTESIRPYIPFIVDYAEEFTTREEAITREKYFKSAAGRRFLKKKLLLVQCPPVPNRTCSNVRLSWRSGGDSGRDYSAHRSFSEGGLLL